jgi:hypothetical protein
MPTQKEKDAVKNCLCEYRGLYASRAKLGSLLRENKFSEDAIKKLTSLHGNLGFDYKIEESEDKKHVVINFIGPYRDVLCEPAIITLDEFKILLRLSKDMEEKSKDKAELKGKGLRL